MSHMPSKPKTAGSIDGVIPFEQSTPDQRGVSRTVSQPATRRSPRPPYPPESVSRRGASFQFPKSLLNLLQAPLAWLSHRGRLIGPPPRCHVVMCGFPRSGTTLCQLMVQACVPDVQCFTKERKALEVARYAIKHKPYIFTKRPSDIFMIEDLRKFYAPLETDVRFILFMRDPRDVLISMHADRPNEYYVSAERWKGIWRHWTWAAQFPDVLSIRFEELIMQTEQVEQKITEHVGWKVERPFRRFHENIPAGFDTAALNGLRPVDPTAIRRWQKSDHRERLIQVLQEIPELPELLIQLGYETSDDWIRCLHQKVSAA